MVAITACAPAVPRVASPTQIAADPEVAYAALRRREDAIRTLRARFSATVHQGDTVRHADGVLLVKKPDRFRMRLLSPFGLTVFDYTSWDAHARMELPLQGKRFTDGEIASGGPFAPADLRQAFLRGGAAFPGRCTPRAAGAETVVDCRDGAGVVLREIRIEPRAQTVSEEISFTDSQPHLLMRFTDYREVGAATLPFSIELAYPRRDVVLEITLRGYEVNPALADHLFGAPEDTASTATGKE
jgi:hypothetical protein